MHPVALSDKDILSMIGGGNNYEGMDQEDLVEALRGVLGRGLEFVKRLGKAQNAPIPVQFGSQFVADECLLRLRRMWGSLNKDMRRAGGNRDGLGFAQFHSKELRKRFLILDRLRKTLKKAFGQKEKGQSGILSYEILPG